MSTQAEYRTHKSYDAQREARRKEKLKAQHECYEQSYTEAVEQLSKEYWFQALPKAKQDRHLSFRAVDIFLAKDCSK